MGRHMAEGINLSGSLNLNSNPIYLFSGKSLQWANSRFEFNDVVKLSSHLLLGNNQEIRFDTMGTRILKWESPGLGSEYFYFNSHVRIDGNLYLNQGFVSGVRLGVTGDSKFTGNIVLYHSGGVGRDIDFYNGTIDRVFKYNFTNLRFEFNDSIYSSGNLTLGGNIIATGSIDGGAGNFTVFNNSGGGAGSYAANFVNNLDRINVYISSGLAFSQPGLQLFTENTGSYFAVEFTSYGNLPVLKVQSAQNGGGIRIYNTGTGKDIARSDNLWWMDKNGTGHFKLVEVEADNGIYFDNSLTKKLWWDTSLPVVSQLHFNSHFKLDGSLTIGVGNIDAAYKLVVYSPVRLIEDVILGSGATTSTLKWYNGGPYKTLTYSFTNSQFEFNDKVNIAGDLVIDTSLFKVVASTDSIGFFGTAPTTKPTALTTQLTTVTITGPTIADYIIQDLTNVSPYGFADAEEGRTVLSVIKNLQDRLSQLENKLQSLGLLS